MKKIPILLLIFLSLSLLGCDSDLSKVKTGTLAFDKSISIGDAIDNYKYFTKVEWRNFTTDNKKRVVEFVATFDKSIFEFKNEKNPWDMPFYYEMYFIEMTNFGADLNEEQKMRAFNKLHTIYDYLNKYDLTLQVQFVINKDDSFNISYAELKYIDCVNSLDFDKLQDTLYKIYNQNDYATLSPVYDTIRDGGRPIEEKLTNEGII